MSGGVGPCSDIRLPKEEEVAKHEQDMMIKSSTFSNSKSPAQTAAAARRRGGGLFTFRQLNALAVAIVLSASGMVSAEDFAFVVFSFIYMYFISRVAFPSYNYSLDVDPIFDRGNKILGLYTFIGAVIGLFLPIAYIFEGIFEGDKEGIKAAAPHVFLLASQVFMEGVAFSDRFSVPIRVFVPVFYNSMRILSILEWLRAEISKVDELHSGGAMRLLVGRGLALANLAFWCFNLFGFLLPVYLPKAFKKYYSSISSSYYKVM